MTSKNYDYKLILTSRGLHTSLGRELLHQVFQKEAIERKSIFLISLKEYKVDDILLDACLEMGFERNHIFFSKDYEDKKEVDYPDVSMIYCTEGNTFLIQEYCRKYDFYEYIRDCVYHGATYIGASAGAMLSSWDIRQAGNFESNSVGVTDFRGLQLMPDKDTVIPHYTFRELKRYVDGMAVEERESYSAIYNVADEEALIMDVKMDDERRRLVRKKRMREE